MAEEPSPNGAGGKPHSFFAKSFGRLARKTSRSNFQTPASPSSTILHSPQAYNRPANDKIAGFGTDAFHAIGYESVDLPGPSPVQRVATFASSNASLQSFPASRPSVSSDDSHRRPLSKSSSKLNLPKSRDPNLHAHDQTHPKNTMHQVSNASSSSLDPKSKPAAATPDLYMSPPRASDEYPNLDSALSPIVCDIGEMGPPRSVHANLVPEAPSGSGQKRPAILKKSKSFTNVLSFRHSSPNTMPNPDIVDKLFSKLRPSFVLPDSAFQSYTTKRKWEILLYEDEINPDFDLQALTASMDGTRTLSNSSSKGGSSSKFQDLELGKFGSISRKLMYKDDGPEWYISRAMASKLTSKDYRRLIKRLDSKSGKKWSMAFKTLGGEAVLCVTLRSINTRSIKSNEDITKETLICQVLKTLVSTEMAADGPQPAEELANTSVVRTNCLIIESIMHSLLSPSQSTRRTVTEILIYHTHDQSHDYFSSIHEGFEVLKDAYCDTAKFQRWMSPFESSIDQHYSTPFGFRGDLDQGFKDYAWATLALINALIDKCPGARERVTMRKDLAESRLHEICEKLRLLSDDDINRQLDDYEIDEDEDYSQLLTNNQLDILDESYQSNSLQDLFAKLQLAYESASSDILDEENDSGQIKSILYKLVLLKLGKTSSETRRSLTLLDEILAHLASDLHAADSSTLIQCIQRLADRMETDETARKAVMEAAELRDTVESLLGRSSASWKDGSSKRSGSYFEIPSEREEIEALRREKHILEEENRVMKNQLISSKIPDIITEKTVPVAATVWNQLGHLKNRKSVFVDELESLWSKDRDVTSSSLVTQAQKTKASLDKRVDKDENASLAKHGMTSSKSHLSLSSSKSQNSHGSAEYQTALSSTEPQAKEPALDSSSTISAPPPPPPPPLLPAFLSGLNKEEGAPVLPPPPPPPPLPPGFLQSQTAAPPPPPPPMPNLFGQAKSAPPPPPMANFLQSSSAPGSREGSAPPPAPPPPLFLSQSAFPKNPEAADGSEPSAPPTPSNELDELNSNGDPDSGSLAVRPKTKLKQMHWSKIDDIDNTLWKEVPHTEMVYELHEMGVLQEVEKAFAAKSSVIKVKTRDGLGTTNDKLQKVTLLPRDLAQRLSINLHMYSNLSVEELISKVLACDKELLQNSSVLEFFSSDALNEISDSLSRAFMPYTSGKESGKPTKDPDELDRPDRIFLEILNMKTYWKSRSRALLLMSSYEKDFTDLRQKLEQMDASTKSIRSSESLKKVLAIIRSVGNFMNDTSKQALGFKLDILQRLKFMKDDSNSMTFLHYVEKIVRNNYPEYGSFVDELNVLQQAQKLMIDQVETDCKEYIRNVSNIATSTKKGNLSMSEQFHPDDRILRVLKRPLADAETKSTCLETLQKRVFDDYSSLMLYFGENFQDSQGRNSFFEKIFSFVADFKRVHVENVQKEEDQRLYEERKQQIELREKARRKQRKRNAKNLQSQAERDNKNEPEVSEDDDSDDETVAHASGGRLETGGQEGVDGVSGDGRSDIDHLLRTLKNRPSLKRERDVERAKRHRVSFTKSMQAMAVQDDGFKDQFYRRVNTFNGYENVESLKRRISTRKKMAKDGMERMASPRIGEVEEPAEQERAIEIVDTHSEEDQSEDDLMVTKEVIEL